MQRPLCELYGTEIIPRWCRRNCGYAEDEEDDDGFYCTYTQDEEDDSEDENENEDQ